MRCASNRRCALAEPPRDWTREPHRAIGDRKEIDMSVAFRRESDEEHKEPKFELPLPPGPNLVTARGLKLMGEKIDALEAAIAAEAEEVAREVLKRELRYWNTRQTTAIVAPLPEGEEV